MPKQSAKIDEIDRLGSRTWRRRKRAGDCIVVVSLFYFFFAPGRGRVWRALQALEKSYKQIQCKKNHLLVSYLSEAKEKLSARNEEPNSQRLGNPFSS